MSVLLRRFVLAVVLLGAVALSGVAQAQVTNAVGLNLSWGDCGANGVVNEDFACDTNAGTHMMVGSFITPAGVTALTGQQGVLDMIVASSTMPAWWTFGSAPNCRAATSFSGAYPGGSVPGSCGSYFGDNAAQGAHVHDYPSPAQGGSLPQTMRIRTVAAIDAGLAGPVAEGSEQYAMSFTINNQRTVGATVCADCLLPACFVFNSLIITQPVGVGDFLISGATVTGRDFVTWQGGSGANCTLVPVKNSTWGQIKSLYR
jgi:hypothetical protein